MFKAILLAVFCCAIASANMKDDIRDKATEALHQGEKVKVCERATVIVLGRARFFQIGKSRSCGERRRCEREGRRRSRVGETP